MGRYKEDKNIGRGGEEEGNSSSVSRMKKWMKRKDRMRACMGCGCALVTSMMGGAVLTLWEYKYHPTNAQQWMVPLGLILFMTPLFVWLAVIVSDFWNPIHKVEEDGNGGKEPKIDGDGGQSTGQCIVFDLVKTANDVVTNNYNFKGANMI